MKAEKLVEIIDADFYTGVPDSQLKALCNYLYERYGMDPKHHIIAANEGNAVALAAGYHLSTGRIPVVYLQNSGEGNIINPVASLLNEKVYAIPVLFIVGWRGEPGVHDEPQHIFQGEVTLKLLKDMGINAFVIGRDTTDEEAEQEMQLFRKRFEEGKCAAFVVRKGALEYHGKPSYHNSNTMVREEIIRHILRFSKDDPVVSTTGKASRELFEQRAGAGEGHEKDFLTVGSMGHSSSIALGIALNRPATKVWCIDGDGAVLMHMGAMAVTGSVKPANLIHVLINNSAHETVGGMPTVAGDIKMTEIARSCGYEHVYKAAGYEELDDILMKAAGEKGLCFIEAECGIGSRPELGRPTTGPLDNKAAFMDFLSKK